MYINFFILFKKNPGFIGGGGEVVQFLFHRHSKHPKYTVKRDF